MLLLREPLAVSCFVPLGLRPTSALSPELLPVPETTPGVRSARSAGLRPFSGSSTTRL